MKNHVLTYKWSTSRGQNSYGYPLLTLTDTNTGKKYRTCGGGYDMLGTVFAEWLKDSVYWEKIKELPAQHGSMDPRKGYYGLQDYNGIKTIDGACGLRCMQEIADAVGLDVTPARKGAVIFVSERV